MSFFTKHGNTKFVGDWKIGDSEYSLIQNVKPIFDAGVFSIQTTPEGEAITGGVTLQAGTGVSLAVDAESKTITLNAEGGLSSISTGVGIEGDGTENSPLKIDLNSITLDEAVSITAPTFNFNSETSILFTIGNGQTFGLTAGDVANDNQLETVFHVRDEGISLLAHGLSYLKLEAPTLDKLLLSSNLGTDCAANTAGGLVVVGGDGKIPSGLYNAGSSYNAGSGISIANDTIVLDLSNYTTTDNISLKTPEVGKTITLASNKGHISIHNNSESYASFVIDDDTVKMNGAGVSITSYTGDGIKIGNGAGAPVMFLVSSIDKLMLQLGMSGPAAGANTANGLAVVGSDGKLPASILPEAGGSFDPTDYQGALNLTNTTDVVNVASLVSNGTNIYLSYSNAENNTVVDLSNNKLDIGVKTAATGETITFDLTDGVSISSEAGLKYNGAALNAANGLVQLGSDGKIPSNLYEAGGGTGGEIDWANVQAPGDIYLKAAGDVFLQPFDTGTVTIINGIEQNKIEVKQDNIDITAEGGSINLLASQEIFIGDLSGQFNCTLSSVLISLSADELVLGAVGTVDFNAHAVRLNGYDQNTAGGFAVVENDGKLPESILPNFVITDGTTEVNATKITLGEGLEVVAGTDGEAIIQRKRRAAIEFTVDDLTENKLLVSESMVGDFVVVDADGVMVIPVIQQIGNDVQIDFTDWTVTGTWKVIFR